MNFYLDLIIRHGEAERRLALAASARDFAEAAAVAAAYAAGIRSHSPCDVEIENLSVGKTRGRQYHDLATWRLS